MTKWRKTPEIHKIEVPGAASDQPPPYNRRNPVAPLLHEIRMSSHVGEFLDPWIHLVGSMRTDGIIPKREF